MNSLTKLLITLSTMIFSIAIVTAQDIDCTALMQKFIEQARELCPEVGSNQACYGSGEVTIDPLDNVRVAFSKPGDTVSLATIKALSTTAYDHQTKNEMGIAILNIGGSFPGTGSTMIALVPPIWRISAVPPPILPF